MVCLRAGRRHQYDLLCDDHLTELSSSRCVHQYEPEGKCVWLLIACHLHKKGGHLPDAHAVVSGHRGADCVCVDGSWTVGALGISNNIGGITTNPQNGFQEGGSSIISQNLGAGRPKRALLAFRWVLYIDMLIGLVIMTASLLCLNQLAGLFAGDNAEFAEMIKQIYRFEAVGAIPLGVNAAVMALLRPLTPAV